MNNPKMNKAQWLDVLKVHTQCLSEGMQKFLKNNRGCMVAWCNGEPVEMRMGKDPHEPWYSVREDKLAGSADVILRLPPKITISADLTEKQANSLYRVMEECTFHTEGSQTARNSIMRSIETELRKAGY